MYCTRCGTQNSDNAYRCTNCGQIVQPEVLAGGGGQPPMPSPSGGPVAGPPGFQVGAAAQSIPNYLVPAILVTIFCCLPLGIPAIVYAAQVSSKQAAGDVPGALAASKSAKTWCWVAAGSGIAVSLIWFLVFAMGALTSR